MKKILFALIAVISFVTGVFAQSPTDLPAENRVYAQGIHSVKVRMESIEFGNPIIKLNSNEKLLLTFDDLQQKDRFYKYTLVHCTHDWQYSSLNQMEYIDGFLEDNIDDYSFSFNTIEPYSHFRLLFPTDILRINKSGNYLLVVFDNTIDNPVLTRRIMIVDEIQAGINATVNYAQDVQFRQKTQQVDFTVYTGSYSIRNPSMNLHATIMQNGRWDNAIVGLTYRTAKTGEYGFNFDNLNKNIFNGINEFRTFDLRTLRSPADRVTSINFDRRINQAYILEDLARPWGAYVTNTTLKGHCYYANSDFAGDNTEDYVLTHFTLRCDFQVGDGNLYVFGELTDWQIQERAKLTLNPENNYWETEFFLKQGYYNYMYVFVPNGAVKIDDTYIEGNNWQTQNYYTILLYLKDEGTSYDKLIGTSTTSIK